MDDPAVLEERVARNRHAREVIAGLDVTPGMHQHHPAAQPPPWSSPRAAMPTISDPRVIYALCLAALLVAGAIVALFVGLLPASIVFFVAGLVLLAGFFVF